MVLLGYHKSLLFSADLIYQLFNLNITQIILNKIVERLLIQNRILINQNYDSRLGHSQEALDGSGEMLWKLGGGRANYEGERTTE